MAVGYHRPYRLASAPPLTRHSLVALGLISRLGGLDCGIVQGHGGTGYGDGICTSHNTPNSNMYPSVSKEVQQSLADIKKPVESRVCALLADFPGLPWTGSLSNQSYIYLIINIIN